MNESNTNKEQEVKWWKAIFAKKWTFPAIYLLASVLIVSILWAKTDTGNYQLGKDDNMLLQEENYAQQQPDDFLELDSNIGDALEADAQPATDGSVPTVANDPAMIWPLQVTDKTDIITIFYDEAAPAEQRSKAIYEYDNTIYNSTGIDIINGNQKFAVFAVADGKVIIAENDVLYGKKIKIAHANGMETVYASLSDMTVKVGDEVKAGDTLGTAGKSRIKSKLPNHLYFEVYQDGKAVDPVATLPELSAS